MTTAYEVITYLTQKDTLERKRALDDLAGLGLFNSFNTNADTARIVQAYLDDNPRNFCDDGIIRFRKALGITSKRTILLTIKVQSDHPGLGSEYRKGDFQYFTDESRVKDRIENALLQSFGDNGDTFTFTRAEVLGCTVHETA